MSRLRKNQKVDTLKHRSGVEVDLFLNPNDLTFVASLSSDISFKDNNADAVRLAVKNYLDTNSRIEWRPVISVHEQKPFSAHDYAFVGIELNRFHIGMDAKQCLRRLRWDDFDGNNDWQRIVHSQSFHGLKTLILPAVDDSCGRSDFYMDYTDSLWNGLEAIRSGIIALKDRLRELLTTPDGHNIIAQLDKQALYFLPPAKQ